MPNQFAAKNNLEDISDMPPMGWTDALSVRHSILDSDHQSFFSISTLLIEAGQDATSNQLVISGAMSLLKEYANGHFLREEMAMRAASYPNTETHIKEHMRFMTLMLTIVSDYKQGNDTAARLLGLTTIDWMQDHIMDHDMKYQPWIKEHTVDSRPLVHILKDYGQDDDADSSYIL